MPWKNIVKSEHKCELPRGIHVHDADAQTGSTYECWICGQLYVLTRGNFRIKWTAVEEES